MPNFCYIAFKDENYIWSLLKFCFWTESESNKFKVHAIADYSM